MIAGRGCQTKDVKETLRRMFGNWTSGCECQAQDVRDIGITECPGNGCQAVDVKQKIGDAQELDAREWVSSTVMLRS